jgi:uncharacterized membrane protein YgaE (UPF0421/DUF939 family)
MNIYDQLLEIHEQLSDDEMWLTILESAYDELEVDNIDDLIDVALETQDEGIIFNLISEGESILSLKDMDNFYDEGEYDGEY